MANETQTATPAVKGETLPSVLASPEDIALAYRAIMDGENVPVVEDPEAASRMILARIADADSFEDAFATQKVPSWKDVLLGEPVRVVKFHLNKSTYRPQEGRTGSSVYAIVELVPLREGTGETMTVQTGGRNVLVQLVKMLERGWLDNAVKLTARPTGDGNEVLWLEAA